MNEHLIDDIRVAELLRHHIPRLIELFEQSVRLCGPEHYSQAQVEQWARGARHPGLIKQLREHHGWIVEPRAEQAGIPLGFVTLSEEGHLSLLYVDARYQRRGLGGLLLGTVLEEAKRLGLKRLTTEASAFSRELFLRHGFTPIGSETVTRGGVSFVRHRLDYPLPD